jgi:hypothetical protein
MDFERYEELPENLAAKVIDAVAERAVARA